MLFFVTFDVFGQDVLVALAFSFHDTLFLCSLFFGLGTDASTIPV